ncbi:hypothetical protein [Actinomadura litoris]|uniref:hypothetical protein n=1 Tax=Actinomadura litoris TaxID=2678616 RepID=UPI001FA71AAB|nr:hypothetical protein [Actinomadura litoris]
MSTEVYWRSKTVVIDWALTDLAGAPITDATVSATVTQPDGVAVPASVVVAGSVYRVTFDPPDAGTYAYRLAANGTADSAEEGTFEVRASPTPSPPPTLDPSTDIGRVRLLVPDRDPALLLFADADITAFLAMEGGVKKAAALALESIASSEAMVGKVIKTQDASTDGAKVAAELRARAAELRRQVDEDDPEAGGGFDYVEFRNPFNRRYGAEGTEPEDWWC